jgi:hypothetical protein
VHQDVVARLDQFEISWLPIGIKGSVGVRGAFRHPLHFFSSCVPNGVLCPGAKDRKARQASVAKALTQTRGFIQSAVVWPRHERDSKTESY